MSIRISDMKEIRAFIALPLPDELKQELGQVSGRLANQMPPGSVRWVKPERVHLTLRFLGDTAVSQLPLLSAKMDQLCQRRQPFQLHLQDSGCFPNRKRPRVIWAGLAGDLASLLAIKAELDDLLLPMGWARETRPFRAHLTLGRVKDGRKLRGINWGAKVERVDFSVTALHLIESQLRPTGPIYITQHQSQFQGNY